MESLESISWTIGFFACCEKGWLFVVGFLVLYLICHTSKTKPATKL